MALPCPGALLDAEAPTRVSREILAYRFLLWGAIFCLLGRALQHLKASPPFRALLWSEWRMKDFVENWMGITWETYATSEHINQSIDSIARGFGWLYLVAAVSLLFFRRFRNVLILPLTLAYLGLVFLAYLQYLDSNNRIGEFLEQASQSGSILLLILLAYQTPRSVVHLVAKLCIAMTFLGHGLYAIGFYETPARWVVMTNRILPLGSEGALTFLKIAGTLDILVCVGIFIPRLNRYCLMYACFWGFVTAAARMPGLYSHLIPYASGFRGFYEFILRSPHWAIPLFVLLDESRKKASTVSPLTPAPSRT